MIRLTPSGPDSFILTSDEPVTITVHLTMAERLLAYVYRGVVDPHDHQPLGAFDGTLRVNRPWHDPDPDWPTVETILAEKED